jgi:hypothetical protein
MICNETYESALQSFCIIGSAFLFLAIDIDCLSLASGTQNKQNKGYTCHLLHAPAKAHELR